MPSPFLHLSKRIASCMVLMLAMSIGVCCAAGTSESNLEGESSSIEIVINRVRNESTLITSQANRADSHTGAVKRILQGGNGYLSLPPHLVSEHAARNGIGRPMTT